MGTGLVGLGNLTRGRVGMRGAAVVHARAEMVELSSDLGGESG